MVKTTSEDFSRDDIFPPFVLLRNKIPALKKYTVRDLSEISRGGGGVGILNLGSEIR